MLNSEVLINKGHESIVISNGGIFEKDIIEKIKNDKPEIIEAIQSSGKLDEDTENQLKQIIEEYKKK